MIPTFWNYLFKSYLKVFFLSVFSFVFVLLVTRFKEIARFASLSGLVSDVFYYALIQTPHILPFAIPISCLIASILLFENMSTTNELTALRSNGISIINIITPIVFSGFILFLINFYLVSEISPRCRLKSKTFLYEQTTINPLLLIQRQNLCPIKNSYIDYEKTQDPLTINNLFLITTNPTSKRLHFFFTKEITLKDDLLYGSDTYFITNLPNRDSMFDTLIIEKDNSITTKAAALTQFMKSEKQTKIPTSHLPLRLLLNTGKEKAIFIEILRRIAIGFSAFTFTVLGIAFGIDIGRKKSRRKIIAATLFALIIFISLSIGKSIKTHTLLSSIFFLVPQPIFLFLSYRSIKKVQRGIE